MNITFEIPQNCRLVSENSDSGGDSFARPFLPSTCVAQLLGERTILPRSIHHFARDSFFFSFRSFEWRCNNILVLSRCHRYVPRKFIHIRFTYIRVKIPVMSPWKFPAVTSNDRSTVQILRGLSPNSRPYFKYQQIKTGCRRTLPRTMTFSNYWSTNGLRE